MGNIISTNQTTFIQKKLITINALIAFEVFHAMKRWSSSKIGSFALKLDISKAYDIIKWGFFSHKFISNSESPQVHGVVAHTGRTQGVECET